MGQRRRIFVLLLFLLPLRALSDGSRVIHPVFKPGPSEARVDDLKAKLKSLLQMERSRILELIPAKTGFISADCPNCEGGAQGLQLEWKIDEPEVLTCKYCGEKYPSPNYPDDKVLQVKDPLGRIQEYPYYEDASGRKRFFRARGWRVARDYFMLAAYDLALLYHFSGEKPAAAKAALIIDRFAELYPGFVVTLEVSEDENGFQESPPYNPQGGKWGRWYYDEIPTFLVYAYDLIYDSGELEKLSRERGCDVKRRIEEDFFKAAVKHVRTYPEYYANPSPRIYEGLAAIGRVIGEPELVHDAVRRMEGLFENRFFFDGMWKEGSYGYHRMTMLGMDRALQAAGGYSDPRDYADPIDGKNFKDLNLEKEIPMLGRARRATEKFCYPDGRFLPVHDSWSRYRGVYQKSDPPLFSAPALWAGMGHAYLGRGRGREQVQAGLHFGGGYGHHHDDSLNLSLFAYGDELLPDIGYTHTRFRYWTKSTLGHNTVMVDGLEQDAGSEGRPGDGDLALFLSGGEDFQVLEASASRVYPGRVKNYARTLILVGVDDLSAYLLDIFGVDGGGRHELAFHGSADEEQTLSLQAQLLSPEASLLPPGVKFEPPRDENDTGKAGGVNPAYGFLRDIKKGTAGDILVATFQPTAGAGTSLRIWTFPPSGAEVFSALAPSVRLADENDSQVDKFWLPFFLIRKEGMDLSEDYISVLEPFRARPAIQKVRRLDVKGAGLGVCISGPDWTDYLLYRSGDSGQIEPATGGGLGLRGRIGWVRLRDGKVAAMGLVNGTELSFGNKKITGLGPRSANVLSVLRKASGHKYDALEIDTQFPKGFCPKGQAVVVRHGDGSTHGHILGDVIREGGKTFLVLPDEPGFEITPEGDSRFLFFPKRKTKGPVTCLVPEIKLQHYTGVR